MSIEPSVERDFQQLRTEVITLLEAKGEEMAIPDRFSAQRMCAQWDIPVAEVHRLTGMSKLTDELRNALALKLKYCVLNSKPFLIVHVDADNLKLANTKWGHWFGNICIERSAAHTAKIVDRFIEQTDHNMKVMMVIPSETAADDLLAAFFPESEDEVDKVIKALEEIDVPVVLDDTRYGEYTFSSSYAFARSSDKSLKTAVDRETEFLQKNTKNLPLKLLNNILHAVENRAHFYKEVKSVLELPSLLDLVTMGDKEYEDTLVDLETDKRGVKALARIKTRVTGLRSRLKNPSLKQVDREEILKTLKEEGYQTLFPEINFYQAKPDNYNN